MARLRAPTHVVFLGGAGTKIGWTLPDQKWFFEALLSDEIDNGPDGNPSDFNAYFVNTDTNETPEDIEDDFDKAAENAKATVDDPLDITIDATTIDLGDIDQNLLHPNNVVNETYIPQIMRELDLEAWWLEENKTVDSLKGLASTGVNRKRGLTKAIHRLGQSDNDPLGDLINDLENSNDTPEVAVVVGFGGGTGSGILIDLAYRIIEQTNGDLTLFGSLPAPSANDGPNEKTNAYAALSELEYLELNDRKLFETIHLLPFDAHVDESAFNKGVLYALLAWYNLDDQPDTRQDFSGGENNGPPKYAPFTLTVPQYARYVTEDVEDTESNLESYVQEKETAIEQEADLLESLEEATAALDPSVRNEIVDDPLQPPQNHEYRLENDQANTLRDEIETLQELLGESYMDRIGYHASGTLHEDILDTFDVSRDQAEWERDAEQRAAVAKDIIERLPNSLGDYTQYRPNDGWKGEEDTLIEIAIEQFSLIKRRAGLYRAANGLELDIPTTVESSIDASEAASEAGDDIELALDPDDAGRSAKVNPFIQELNDEESEKERHKEALDKLIDKHAPARVTMKAENCLQDLEPTLDNYYNLYTDREELVNLVGQLEDEVISKVGIAIAANNPEQVPDEGLDFNDFDELETACNKYDDVTAPDSQRVKSSVRNLVRARREILRAKKMEEDPTEAIKEKARGWIGKTQHQTYKDNYDEAEKMIDDSIIDLPAWDEPWGDTDEIVNGEYFDAGVDNELVSARNQLTETVKRHLKDARTEVSDDPGELQPSDADSNVREFITVVEEDIVVDIDEVKEWLKGGWDGNLPTEFDTFKQQFEDPLEDAFKTVLIEPFEDERDEVENELDKYADVRERLETIQNIRMDKGSDYHQTSDNVRDPLSLSVYESPGQPGPFKNEIEPDNEGFLQSDQNLGEAGILSEEDEKDHLVEELVNMLPGFMNDHFPVKEVELTHSEGTPYDGHLVNSVFLSTAFDGYRPDEVAQIDEIWEDLDRMALDKDDYGASRVPAGDDHDVAMTTFLGGVFLDNLTIFADDCKSEYKETMGRSLWTTITDMEDRHLHLDRVPELAQHQGYGLDGVAYHAERAAAQADGGSQSGVEDRFLPMNSDGGFPTRCDTINVSIEDGKRELLVPSEDELVDKLRKEYYRVVGFPSSVDRDADKE
ncbi:tubulin-like doman-containing protein [Halosimplex pelagicum]|uniref:Uncharacterized protein n=1 Tax=Halosimplex pelagicum TaxID=869886 RepID=A0A7D5PB06_9EURY|nr:tubulin-like doman-containing protein [Halosimplex pelagicum]QLH83761.1 hypothetical protein HZS54_19950 [Halosimplex pelagicum]